MDGIVHYRTLIEAILTQHTEVPYAYGNIQIQTVFDRKNDHYLVMLVGRDGKHRVHGSLIHVDIVDDEIWIQRDGTERGIARELIEAGVPKEHIVLAFKSPNMQREIELADV